MSRVYERALFNTCSKILRINFCNFFDKQIKYMYSSLSAKQIIINNLNTRMVTGSALNLFMHRKCALERLLCKGPVSNHGGLHHKRKTQPNSLTNTTS